MTDTVDEVKAALTDVDYPASKDDLLAAAEQHRVGENAMKALRAIPPVDYGNDAEVLSSIDIHPSTPSGDRGPTNPGMHRVHAKPGLAQHMKDAEPTPIEEEVGTNEGS